MHIFIVVVDLYLLQRSNIFNSRVFDLFCYIFDCNAYTLTVILLLYIYFSVHLYSIVGSPICSVIYLTVIYIFWLLYCLVYIYNRVYHIHCKLSLSCCMVNCYSYYKLYLLYNLLFFCIGAIQLVNILYSIVVWLYFDLIYIIRRISIYLNLL